MSFITRKRTVHLRSVRPQRKRRVKRGPDERPAQAQALCGEFVETGAVVRFDRVPPSVTNLCPDCASRGKTMLR